MHTPRVPVRPEQDVEMVIDTVGHDGDGLGKVGNYVVFVPRAMAGERVRARITSAGRKHGRADLLAVLEPSADRVTPRCPHFGACGGCQLQHMTYPAQLELKQLRVQRTLSHALRRDIEVPPLAAPAQPWGQRSKVVLHVERRPSGYRAGLYGQRSRSLVPLDECPASHAAAFALARKAVQICERQRVPAFDRRYGDGALRGVLVRATSTGQLGVVLISASAALPQERAVATALADAGAAAVWVNHLPTPMRVRDGALPTRVDAFEPVHLLGSETRCVHGNDRLDEELLDVRYVVSPTAFFQTSLFGAEELVRQVVAMAEPLAGKKVIDAYCGSGLLTLALARSAASVIGVEDDALAVADAEAGARRNGRDNVRFIAGPAQRLLPTLATEAPDVVVLDPPRAGCHAGVLETVAQALRPRRVVYVACDTDSLARDAARLEELEYAVERVQPLDMFPFTHHVETVVAFARNPQARTGAKRFSRAAGERLLAKARASRAPD
ncbi:MAG: 23S rRNA (uracil(1939)-C(5))-methyltransferase RlmD [Planctomycetota bacterium]